MRLRLYRRNLAMSHEPAWPRRCDGRTPCATPFSWSSSRHPRHTPTPLTPAPITIYEVFDGQAGLEWHGADRARCRWRGRDRRRSSTWSRASSRSGMLRPTKRIALVGDRRRVLDGGRRDRHARLAFAQRATFNAINQRWYISAEEATNGTPNRIYLAVSASADALGSLEGGHVAGAGQRDRQHAARSRCVRRVPHTETPVRVAS